MPVATSIDVRERRNRAWLTSQNRCPRRQLPPAIGATFRPASPRRGIRRHPAVGAGNFRVAIFAVAAGARKISDRIFRARRARRLRHVIFAAEHAAAFFAADPDRALRRAAGAHRPGGHRRRRRARARRLRVGGRRHSAGARQSAAVADAVHHGIAGMLVGAVLDRHRRLSALRARRQRNDLIAADDLYRHRHHEFLRRGIAARSDQSQQAFDHADRRRLHGRPYSRHRRALGHRRRHRALRLLLYILLSRTTFGFAVRVAGGNPRAALAQGLPVGKLIVICCAIAGACAGLRRLLRGRGDPGPRQCVACRRLRLYRNSGGVPGAA